MTEKKKRGRPKTGKAPKKLRSIKLEPEFETALVNAAYWSRTTVNAILEEGAAIRLRQLQDRDNGGKPFPPKPEVATDDAG